MWRKQEQPKAPSPVPEATVGSAVGASDKPITLNAHNTTGTTVSPSSSPIKPGLDSPAVGSRLTNSLTIKGEITGREDLLIDANLDGLIHLDGATVTVGPSGRLTANIEAGEIVVHGDVKGGLSAAERVRVGPTGRTTGDIVARRIFIEAGAEIHGRVEVMRTDETPAVRAAVPTSAQIAVPRPAESAQSVQSPTEEPSAAA